MIRTPEVIVLGLIVVAVYLLVTIRRAYRRGRDE